ncbi:MAGUK p55 subfamily member 7 [Bagarius yarrelli]|uniref:MAGUK p55 subfamily member 7 n=1 Tax=Bagarius yarrelli TaxID=175774 RepID=A0A556V9J9_BAGYA|nr:MAGUK p55 subfamily member 7 [Bagarius yarrelli]
MVPTWFPDAYVVCPPGVEFLTEPCFSGYLTLKSPNPAQFTSLQPIIPNTTAHRIPPAADIPDSGESRAVPTGQGATIKKDEKNGAITIARIMKGGAADRSGLIHLGDELKEVNGISVEGKNPEEIIKILVC